MFSHLDSLLHDLDYDTLNSIASDILSELLGPFSVASPPAPDSPTPASQLPLAPNSLTDPTQSSLLLYPLGESAALTSPSNGFPNTPDPSSPTLINSAYPSSSLDSPPNLPPQDPISQITHSQLSLLPQITSLLNALSADPSSAPPLPNSLDAIPILSSLSSDYLPPASLPVSPDNLSPFSLPTDSSPSNAPPSSSSDFPAPPLPPGPAPQSNLMLDISEFFQRDSRRYDNGFDLF